MYENPGYQVFDWRSQEGLDNTKGKLDKLRLDHNAWRQRQDMAAKMREKQELDEARRRAERAGQYANATQGVGAPYYLAAPDQKAQSPYDIYRPADFGIDQNAGSDYGGGSDFGGSDFSPGEDY